MRKERLAKRVNYRAAATNFHNINADVHSETGYALIGQLRPREIEEEEDQVGEDRSVRSHEDGRNPIPPLGTPIEIDQTKFTTEERNL